MSQALRDACVGIIELAHPDTKPLLREDYMKVFHGAGAQHNVLSAKELQQQRDAWAYLFKVHLKRFCQFKNCKLLPKQGLRLPTGDKKHVVDDAVWFVGDSSASQATVCSRYQAKILPRRALAVKSCEHSCRQGTVVCFSGITIEIAKFRI